MAITWRTVTAPNNQASNRLMSEGIETLLGGISNVAGVLKAPQEKAEEEEKLAFEKMQVNARAAREQERIDNQDRQSEERIIAARLAADIANTRGIDRDKMNNEQSTAAAEQAHKNAVALQNMIDARMLKTNEADNANLLLREEVKAGGAAGSSIRRMKDYIDGLPNRGASNTQIANAERFATWLNAQKYGGDLSQMVLESTFTPGLVYDHEELAPLFGANKGAPAEFREYANIWFNENPEAWKRNELLKQKANPDYKPQPVPEPPASWKNMGTKKGNNVIGGAENGDSDNWFFNQILENRKK